jgi:hypothetical protein
MCDTLFCSLRDKGSPSKAFFGKNSDRHPTEAQSVCIVNRRQPSDSSLFGERRLPIPDAGFAFFFQNLHGCAAGRWGSMKRASPLATRLFFPF